jgi:hypothetical protein
LRDDYKALLDTRNLAYLFRDLMMHLLPLFSIICLGLVPLAIACWAKRRRRRKRKAADGRIPSEFERFVGMTSRQERNFVYQYAANDFKGEGAIVDLGCWLGSFTLSLAMGLRENPRVKPPGVWIHAYDLFSWEDWMNPHLAGTRWADRYKEGDNFRDAFIEQIAPVADLVAIHPGDLTKERWEPAAPIEYLLIDAMKSWELANSVIRNFFPALKPGLSLVHHHDFVHYYTPWIHLIMYRFRRYFEPLTYVPDGSYIFACRQLVPRELLERPYQWDDFSDEEADDAFEYSLSHIPATASANVLAARIMMHIHRRDWAGARTALERVRADGIPLEKELTRVSKLLEDHVA